MPLKSFFNKIVDKLSTNKVTILYLLIGIFLVSVNNSFFSFSEFLTNFTQKDSSNYYPERNMSLNVDVITDAGNVIGMAPVNTVIIDKISSYEFVGLEVMLNNKDVGVLNWLPVSIKVKNISRRYSLLIKEVVLEVSQFEENIPELQKVFDVHPGSHSRKYDIVNIAINPDTRENKIFPTGKDAAKGAVSKKFYNISPGMTEVFNASITGDVAGQYDIHFKITYSVNGMDGEKQTIKKLRLIQLENPDNKPTENIDSMAKAEPLMQKSEVHLIPPKLQPRKLVTTQAIAAPKQVASLQDIATKPTKPIEQSNITRPGIRYYSVQVGAFKNKSGADKIYQNLKTRGYSAFLIRSDGNGNFIYRVRVGKFKSRIAAQRYSELFKQNEKLEIYIVNDRETSATVLLQ